MFGRNAFAVLCLAALTAFTSLAQEENFNSKLGHVRYNVSKLEDVISIFGEPSGLYNDDAAYTKESLPESYYADFPQGITVRMIKGSAATIEVRTTDFLLFCRIRTGDNLLDVIESVGHPTSITAGPFPSVYQDRVLYFENADYSGPAMFADYARGVRFAFYDGVLQSIFLMNQRANQGWIPPYTDSSPVTYETDLRSANLCGTDLRDHLQTLLHSQFDDRTVWPPAELLPEGFLPADLIDKARNPGLGVRALHEQGITGKGVSIAIVDSTPRLDHAEYASRIRHIEWVGGIPSMNASYHGGLVTSLAAGASIGVAPEAGIYYVIAPTDYAAYADAIHRIIDLNRALPFEERIRVLSISWGWQLGNPEAAPYAEAVREASDEGIFVVTPAIFLQQGYSIFGLGRDPRSDPDDPSSYEPGLFMQEDFFAHPSSYSSQFWVPMDARLMAGQHGPEAFYFYRTGGLSDAIPWYAGLYALACQANPGMTAAMMKTAMTQTARNVEITHDGRRYTLRGVVDPAALIDAVRTQ